VDGKLLDELQVFLSERSIRPGMGEWAADREWIRMRLHQEIFNHAAFQGGGLDIHYLERRLGLR